MSNLEAERIPMEIIKKDAPKKSFLEIACPYCAGANFVKRGLRQKKKETVQLYLCNDCRKTFTPGATKGKHYPMSVILDAMSLYYLGYSLEEAAKLSNKISDANKSNVETPDSDVSKTTDIKTPDSDVSTDKNILSGATLLTWITQYQPLCAFARMREYAVKMFSPKEIISSATLAHRQLYRFRHHRAKTILIIREDFKHSQFWPLKDFLDLVPVECPHQYFQEGMRASEAPIMFSKTEMIVRGKNNFANKMAKFVLESVDAAKDRHDALQRFMLANDSVTVATEVPVYLRREDLLHMQTQLGFQLFKKNKNSKNPNGTYSYSLPESLSANVMSRKDSGNATPESDSSFASQNQNRDSGVDKNVKSNPNDSNPKNKKTEKELEEFKIDDLPKLITGHIDFVQIRNGQIHILDYKPNAAKERPIEQLTLYALALSRLTGLKVFNFKCAWFDEKDYFEFFPLHVVYKPDKKRKRRKINTIEGTYVLNENAKRVEKIRPDAERSAAELARSYSSNALKDSTK